MPFVFGASLVRSCVFFDFTRKEFSQVFQLPFTAYPVKRANKCQVLKGLSNV